MDQIFDKKICEICGTENNIERHHVSYKKTETVDLCRKCHMDVHSDKTHPFYPVDVRCSSKSQYPLSMRLNESETKQILSAHNKLFPNSETKSITKILKKLIKYVVENGDFTDKELKSKNNELILKNEKLMEELSWKEEYKKIVDKLIK